MPRFRMPDGSFIEAPNYAAARAQQDAARKAAVHAPARAAVPPPAPVTITPALTPLDNFAGRSKVRFGVGEQIKLGFTTNPLGRSAASFGGLQWFVGSGSATVANDPGNTGTGTLTCGDKAGAVVLELRTVSAPITVKASKHLEVVAPTDAVMARAAGTGTFHRHGTASAGFDGEIFLRPMDVSFIRTQFREGAAPYEATGSFAKKEVAVADINRGEIRHPILGNWIPVLGGNSASGSKMNGQDTVRSATLNPPYAVGTFTWNIPWYYRVVGTLSEHRFTTAAHHESVTATGQMTISKKGTTVTHNAADPDSDP